MFETINNAHHLLSGHGQTTHLAHATQKLNLVGSNTEVYNSYGSGAANEGGNYDHPGHTTSWSPYYTQRPIDGPGLVAEGGAWGEGHTYACDNDGFGCYMYNRQAFDDVPRILSESGRDLGDAVLTAPATGAVIDNQDTYNLYHDFGVGAETMHVHQGIMENIPFFYPPRQPGKYPKPPGIIGGGAAKIIKPPVEDDEEEADEPTIAPPKSCPLWADCTGTGNFHLGEGYD